MVESTKENGRAESVDGTTTNNTLSKSAMDAATKLKWLYLATTTLSIMMVFWILLFPASWLFGRWKLHNDLLLQVWEDNMVVGTAIVTKYEGHTAIHLLHFLPGSVWSGIIPFQLHNEFRKNHGRLHRFLGTIFLVCAAAMSVGIGIILHRGLLFENFFEDLPADEIFLVDRKIVTPILTVAATLWFAFTAVQALRYAKARQFRAHQKYIVRHIASGMWIAVQRVVIPVLFSPFCSKPVPRYIQREAFANGASLGMIISYSAGEYAVHLLNQLHQRRDVKAD